MNARAEETGQEVARVDNPFANAPVVAAPTGAAAQALIQREVAEVQAAMVIAHAHPRSPVTAMDRILMACSREGLAEAALYTYSRGGQEITGPSIRLAEELARQWGNILCGVSELGRYAGHSEVLTYCWDLETGFRDEKRFTVRHWRDTRSGGYAVTEERDVYELLANYAARRKRACILTVIPGDVVEAAVRQCEVTLNTKGKVTPELIASMFEKFAFFNVGREQLEKRLQRRFESITPTQVVSLGKILNSLKDGMSKAADWFDMPEGSQQPEGPKGATQTVKDKLAARRGKEDATPHHDKDTAIAAIKAAKNLKQLGEIYEAILKDFADTGRQLPVEVEGSHADRKALLEQE